jgi:hypothetical protein
MISETLEPFLNAGMAVLLWGFVAFLWVLSHELLKDHLRLSSEYCTLKEYAIAGLVVVTLCAMTFIVLMWTLSIMGV